MVYRHPIDSKVPSKILTKEEKDRYRTFTNTKARLNFGGTKHVGPGVAAHKTFKVKPDEFSRLGLFDFARFFFTFFRNQAVSLCEKCSTKQPWAT